MGFLTPYFLIGLSAAAVPVLIHLMIRDHVRRVEFSTLRFFVKTSRMALRRKRLQELILVALRALVCALLAIAFARPLLARRDEADTGALIRARHARAIVVDVSGSMARADAAAVADRARAALADLREGDDAVAVIAFSSGARVAAPLSTQFAEAARAVDELRCGQGGTNIPQALRAADAQLARAHAGSKDVVLISDLQRTGWRQRREDFKLAAGVKLEVRPVEPAGGGNLAVVAARTPQAAPFDRQPVALRVRVADYSDRPREGVTVRLKLGAQTQTRALNFRAHGQASATFRHVFDRPGEHTGTIEVLSDDEGADNVHYFSTRVAKIQVVLLDGGMSPGRSSTAAMYFEKAMKPDPQSASPFEAKTFAPSRVGAGALRGARVAVLVDVSEVPPAVRGALADLLGRGGGLLFVPGAGTDAAAFARCFADLAPCKLRRVRTARMLTAGTPGAHLARIDFDHPIFEVFSHPRHGDLSLAKFRRYWEVTDSQLAQVLAKFDDNRPAVLSREIGGGVSMLLAAAPHRAWTDWARRSTFLPWVHETLAYLGSRAERGRSYTVGDPLPIREGESAERVADAGESGAGEAEAIRGGHAVAAGLYTLKDADGQAVMTFAVNRDPAEADPAVVPPDEIVAAMERPAGAAGARAAHAGGDREDAEPADELNLWRWVLVATALLLAGELLLGNHTLRH